MSPKFGTHVVQQQIAVQPGHIADLLHVAIRAADGLELLVAVGDHGRFLGVRRLPFDRRRQPLQVADQRIAFGLVHIEAGGFVIGLERQSRLGHDRAHSIPIRRRRP